MKKLLMMLCLLASASGFAEMTLQEIEARQVGGTLYLRGADAISIRFLCDEGQDPSSCESGQIVRTLCDKSGVKKQKHCDLYDTSWVLQTSSEKAIRVANGKDDFLESLAPKGLQASLAVAVYVNPILGFLMLPPAVAYDIAATPIRATIGAGRSIAASVRIRQFLRSIRKNNRKFKRTLGKRTFENVMFRMY